MSTKHDTPETRPLLTSQAALADSALLDKIEQVCRPRIANPYAQRYHFWMHYAKARRANR
jgi:hypothetical protein